MALSAGLSGCTRKAAKESRVGISLSGILKSGKNGALTYDEISHIAINVSGGTLGAPKVINWDGHRQGTVVAPPDFFVIEVPSGDYLIQVLVVANDSTTGLESFLYGDQFMQLVPGDNAAKITATTIGTTNGSQGNVSGRYLTGTAPDRGPTGELELIFQPPVAGRPPMTIMDTPMINGWFRIFLIDGAQFSYRFKHNRAEVLFNGVDMNHATFAPSDRVVHLIQPPGTAYWSGDNRTEARSEERYIVGFFGPAATSGTRKACYTAAGTVTNLYTDAFPAHVTPMQYDPSTTDTTKVRRLGNSGGNSKSTCDALTVFQDALVLDGTKLGSGKDQAFGFDTIFKIPLNAWSPLTASHDGSTLSLTWDYVSSDVIGADGADGVAVLISTNGWDGDMKMGGDGVNCSALLNETTSGFYVAGTVTTNSFSTAMTSTDYNNLRLAVCPFKNGYLGKTRHYFSGVRLESGGGGGGGGPAAKIGFRHGSAVTNVSSCTEMDVVLLNASGTDSDGSLNTGISVDLAASGLTVDFKSGGCSGSYVSSITIPSGSNSARVGLQVSVGTGVATLEATSASPALPAETGNTLMVVPGGLVTRLDYQTDLGGSINVLVKDACTAIRVQFSDSSGSAQNIYSALTLNLSGGTGVSFYSDSGCTTAITSKGVTSGVAATDAFYVMATVSGWASLSANVSSYDADGTYIYDLAGMHGVPSGGPGEPVQLGFIAAGPMTVDNCYTIQVETLDSLGSPAAITPGLGSIEVYNSGFAGGAFFADSITCAAGTPEITPVFVSIAGGASTSETIYYRPAFSGTASFSARFEDGSRYLTGGSGNITVNP